MKKGLGIFRGFPGLGRVVAGVSILETLRDKYNFNISIITYLQGNEYLRSRDYTNIHEAIPMDYCSIGLLPTNQMAVHIHNTIKDMNPDFVLVDGEPLILQSLRISYPELKIITLLNPSDVDNSKNDKEAMDYFNALYSLSDLAIIHGLKHVTPSYDYKNFISVNTILRNEILTISHHATNNIYCVLGGGTVNAGNLFSESSIGIGELCIDVASSLKDYTMNIICSSQNIYDVLHNYNKPSNVVLYKNILQAQEFYTDACLIVTRSGRNSLSELAYLGIPSISFISGCKYRSHEQEENIRSLNTNNIVTASLDCSITELKSLCLKMMNQSKDNKPFCCGNDTAIKSILELLQA